MYNIAASLVIFLILVNPLTAEARHSNEVSLSSLGGDRVEEIPIPVLFGITYEDINPDFGDPRGDGSRNHEGEDILAPEGTPIVSPTKAVVLSTDTGSSAGNYVYTANPGGEVFRYMHLEYIADVKRGDKLDPGDFIGTVGDTGNAPDGVYHLHFEIRENGSTPIDPYPRMTDTFTLKEKTSFLENILNDVKNEDEYAAFLVSTFGDDFRTAFKAGYRMPRDINDALVDAGIVGNQSARDNLETTLKAVPRALTNEIIEGDQGLLVTLLQVYIIYMNEGEARDDLKAAGPTGFYGPVTAKAVRELQEKYQIAVTGNYDAATRKAIIADTQIGLNL